MKLFHQNSIGRNYIYKWQQTWIVATQWFPAESQWINLENYWRNSEFAGIFYFSLCNLLQNGHLIGCNRRGMKTNELYVTKLINSLISIKLLVFYLLLSAGNILGIVNTRTFRIATIKFISKVLQLVMQKKQINLR